MAKGDVIQRTASVVGNALRFRVRIAWTLVLGLTLTVNLAGDANGVRIDGEPRVLSSTPLSLYRPHLDDRAVEQETWDYVFWFPSGHRLLAQFQVTDAGPGTRTGLVAAMIVFPDKTTRLIKNSRPRAEWTDEVRGSTVKLSLAGHVFEIGDTRHHVHVESRTEQIDVTADAIEPAVTLGTVRYGARDRYELAVLAPRVRCTATIQIDGKPQTSLTGGGIVLHSISTLPDYNQALNVFRLHTFDVSVGPTFRSGDTAETSLLSFTAPVGKTAVPVGWLLTMAAGKAINIRRDLTREYQDTLKEREDPGYLSPRSVRLSASGPEPLEATVSLSLVGRFDILSWINSAIGRFLARRYFHPVQYLFDARYDLQMGAGSEQSVQSSSGFGLLWILNQPNGTGR